MTQSKKKAAIAAALLWSAAALVLAPCFRQRSQAQTLREPGGAADAHAAFRRLKSGARNLAVFSAVGRPNVLPFVVSNINHHFRHDPDWACVVLVYAGEDAIPADHPSYELIDAACPIVRIPRTRWGTWLQMFHPTFVAAYEKIAVLLDDLLLPVGGPNAVDIPKLVAQMDRYGLSSITPAIEGGNDWYNATMPRPPPGHEFAGCSAVLDDSTIEIFFQMYTAETWTCFYNMLDYRNTHGWCYDACLSKRCPGAHAVDYRMVAYHLENADVPASALEGLDPLDLIKPEHTDNEIINDPDWEEFALCEKYQCGHPQKYGGGKVLECEHRNVTAEG